MPVPCVEPLEQRTLMTIPGTSLGIYHTYAQATADLNTIHNAYPHLTELVSIGKTVNNLDIWALQITDNPGIEEDEPEFYYQGAIHGDEPIGMALSFYFIQHLLENYGSDTRATNLVNSTDIWVVPHINWDGYERAGGAWRYNANGVDLNRNFPEWTTTVTSPDTIHHGPFGNLFDGPAMQTAGLQPETVAVMQFRAAHRFVASASFHSGDLVVNYPWDTNGNAVADYAATPDDQLLRQMALVYSLNHQTMRNSPGFDNGTTNGDAWSPITGGDQDWSYLYTGSLSFTIELNFQKFPPASTLNVQWNRNREPMMALLETAHWGVRGLVTDAATGLPLHAKVRVVGPAPSPTPDPSHPSTMPVFTDPRVGDYHRPLLPGTYTLEVSAPGYTTQTLANVTVTAGATTPLDVVMVPIDATPPTVQQWTFDIDAAAPSLRAQFSEAVHPPAGGALSLVNLTTGQTVPSEWISASYDSATYTATFTFPGFAGSILPNGDYSAQMIAGEVSDLAGNPLSPGMPFPFHVLAGDATRDRKVDASDLAILAANWQQSQRTFSTGDFTYDGVVDIADLAVLTAHWHADLPAPPPQELVSGVFPRRPTVAARFGRIANQILL